MDETQDREQRVRERAYAIWVEAGRPEKRADEHWRAAESAIDEEDATVTPLTAGPDTPPLITPNR